MKPRGIVLLSLGLGALMAVPALATDWLDYPEFRHTSGLPGNGFGVNEEGKVGFGGAFHMNVPCAYTPTLGQVSVGYHSGSLDSRLRFQFGGDETDSTGYIGIGLGKPGKSIYFADVFVEKDLNVNCQHVQWQVQDETHDLPAIAVGIFDMFDNRERRYREPHGTRSYYIVATRRSQESERPLYVTVGYGNGRFRNRAFSAVSWYPNDRFNLGFEYDGMVPRPHLAYSVAQQASWDFTAAVAWPNFERPTLGFSLSFGL